MQPDHSRESRLRIVFDDTIVSYSLAANTTLGEIARQWAELSSRYRGETVAVDVTLRSRASNAARQLAGSPVVPSLT